MIEIYTDGAYNTVSDKGGWAAVLVEGGKEQVISGTANKTTNNRMEITAAFEGITHTPKTAEVVVHTDSQYLYGCMVKGWQRKANLDLFEKLDAAVRERKVRWLWIDQNVPNSYQKSAHTTATSLISQSEASEPAQNKASEAFEVKASETEQVRAAEPLPAKTIEPPPQKIAAAAQPKLIPPTPEIPKLSHVDETGRPRMVDVTAKAETEREALARGTVSMKPETLSLIQKGEISKGDVLTVAQIAGIMAAKQTPQLIPLCHPLLLGDVKVEFSIDEKNSVIEITSTVKTTGKTGVEMEALTAVAVAALTIYDMCKAVEKGIRIEKIRLVKKSGGKSGTITLE